MTTKLTRRALFGAAGVALSIPLLESLMPRRTAVAGVPAQPRRLIVWYVPNGINGSTANAFRPVAAGPDYALTPMLMPLASLRREVSVLTGLANRPAQASYMGSNDGAGDHARGTGSFLTNARIVKTEGAGVRNGVSFDQVAAAAIGGATRLPSLQLGIDGGSATGGCDSGYSCAYARNISWADATTPVPKLTNPAIVFDRLFAGGESAALRARRQAYQSSVLDYVRGDATRLQPSLGATDRQKLDEYLTAVRELERRVMASGATMTCVAPPRPVEGLGYAELVGVMNNLMAMALRCDATRVITFMLGNAGSSRDYSFAGAAGAHHEISHHMSDPEKLAKLQTIGTWEIRQFAALLTLLDGMTEADGTSLLDNSAVLFSSEIGDGNGHWHYSLPVILAGRCGGDLTPGQHIVYGTERPIANLFLALLRAVGATASSFGLEGTRVLENLGPVSMT
jgi:Protein of unknown function (DUF1552)